jgi:5'-3' exonuclease
MSYAMVCDVCAPFWHTMIDSQISIGSTMSGVKNILLVDFSNLFHQAHTPWTQARPAPDNNSVVYNFLNIMTSVYKILDGTHMIFAFDGRSEFRKNMLPSYKENRKKDRDDPVYVHFYRQMEWCYENMTSLICSSTYRHMNLEADDTVYELCHRIIPHLDVCDTITILSSDKDLIQCLDIDSRIKLYSPIGKTFREREDFFLEKKCLIGDKSDNVMGIFRVGEVGATKIVNAGIDRWKSLPENQGEKVAIYERNMHLFKLYRWDDYENHTDTKFTDKSVTVKMTDENEHKTYIRAFSQLGIKDTNLIERTLNMNACLRAYDAV